MFFFHAGNGIFDVKRKKLYGWDPLIPFKPVNKGNSDEKKAIEEELVLMLNYLLHRIQQVKLISKSYDTQVQFSQCLLKLLHP